MCVCLVPCGFIQTKKEKHSFFVFVYETILSEFWNRLWNLKRCCPAVVRTFATDFYRQFNDKICAYISYCTPMHIVFVTHFILHRIANYFYPVSFVVWFSASIRTLHLRESSSSLLLCFSFLFGLIIQQYFTLSPQQYIVKKRWKPQECSHSMLLNTIN